MKRDKRMFRIIGAYDTETTNYTSLKEKYAFTILHILALTKDFTIEYANYTNNNVLKMVQIYMYRHTEEVYAQFENLIFEAKNSNCCFIVMVHNLGFDMWSLGGLLQKYDTQVVAKSRQKPITIDILDNSGEPVLRLWDTVTFYGKSLATMGLECGFPKLKGSWNYDLIRTPYTQLTDKEIEYAKHDVYILFAYLGYYMRLNPDIKEDAIGVRVISKTGSVRYKRLEKYGKLKTPKKGFRVRNYWEINNYKNLPTTDEELYTLHECTRGGFTFCASRWAGVPFELKNTDTIIAGYDATSQHPAQMVSHLYPTNFKLVDPEFLQLDFELITSIDTKKVIEQWLRPFQIAFYGVFKFTNLRVKQGTIFEKNGIYSLSYARVSKLQIEEDEESLYSDFTNFRRNKGYTDTVIEPIYHFGKLEAAKEATLYLTELDAWILSRIYEWDTIEAITGYETTRFTRPSDLSLLSVMGFYQRKNLFKQAMHSFYNGDKIQDLEKLSFIPNYLLQGMQDGSANTADIEAFYLSLKADLNSLFGIEATNEARPDIYICNYGLEMKEQQGIEDLPEKPKTFYQYGQRIVGWSRIAQTVVMETIGNDCIGIVNGDTDSIKIYVKRKNLKEIDKKLKYIAKNIQHSKEKVLARVKANYAGYYDTLDGIGDYVKEFETEYYYSAWNKAYCIFDGKNFNFTLAGIPANIRLQDEEGILYKNAFTDYAQEQYKQGKSYTEIVQDLLGYNLVIDSSISKLNGRKIPDTMGETKEYTITDYKGITKTFTEYKAVCLYPMLKVIGDTVNKENNLNMLKSKENNKDIVDSARLLKWSTNRGFEEIRL